MSETLSLTERQIREHGITYNVYADAQGVHRPWEVDPIPLVLPADEWQAIAAGIEQRAELLNRVLGDLYGAQALMKSGAIPPSVIFGHRGFLAAVEGLKPGRRTSSAAVRRRPGALARRPLVGRRRPHAGALRLGLRAREPARRLARLPADVPRAAGAAPRELLRCAARVAAALGAARRRADADRPAHAGTVQRDLLRARAARALSRLRAGRGQRPHGARRPRLAEDDRRPASASTRSCAARTTTTAIRSSCAPIPRSASPASPNARGAATSCSPTRSARASSSRARCSATCRVSAASCSASRCRCRRSRPGGSASRPRSPTRGGGPSG